MSCASEENDGQEVSTVAEKKQTYKEVVEERDAYKHELDVMKQDRVNRQAKNSVFLNLFMRKEYQLQLYKELFPQDTTITASMANSTLPQMPPIFRYCITHACTR